MKIYGLKIKSGASTSDNLGFSHSLIKSSPLAEKTEWYKTEEQRTLRRQKIEQAVSEIGLVAWLVSLENIESEVTE